MTRTEKNTFLFGLMVDFLEQRIDDCSLSNYCDATLSGEASDHCFSLDFESYGSLSYYERIDGVSVLGLFVGDSETWSIPVDKMVARKDELLVAINKSINLLRAGDDYGFETYSETLTPSRMGEQGTF